MKFKISLFLLMVLVLMLVGCGEDEPKKPVGPTSFELNYPLEVGRYWEYYGLFHYTDTLKDVVKPFVYDSVVIHSLVEVTGIDTLYDSIEVFVVHEEQTNSVDSCGDSLCVRISDSYFRNTDDGLFYYGYDGSVSLSVSMTPLKISTGALIGWNNRYFQSVGDLFIYALNGDPNANAKPSNMESSPLKALDYDFTVNVPWDYRDSTSAFEINKKVSGLVSLQLGPAKYPCWVVEWMYPTEDISIYDYISVSGLLKRKVILDNIILSTYNQLNIDTVSAEYEITAALEF